MSTNNNTSPGDKEGTIRRSPTYAEAAKSASRAVPAPINTSLTLPGLGTTANNAVSASSNSSFGHGSVASNRTNYTSLYQSSTWSPSSVTQSDMMSKKPSWENPLTQSDATHRPAYMPALYSSQRKSESPKNNTGVGFNFNANNFSINKAAPPQTAIFHGSSAKTAQQKTSPPSYYQYQQANLTDAQTKPFVSDAALPNANTFPLQQFPFGSGRDAANQPRTLPSSFQSPGEVKPYNVPIGSERKAAALRQASDAGNKNNFFAADPFATTTTPKRSDSPISIERGEQASVVSDVTKVSSTVAKQAATDGPIIVEQQIDNRGFHPLLRFKTLPSNLSEAFDGAYITLKTQNYDRYELPPNVSSASILQPIDDGAANTL
jgi:hypothetical protein